MLAEGLELKDRGQSAQVAQWFMRVMTKEKENFLKCWHNLHWTT